MPVNAKKNDKTYVYRARLWKVQHVYSNTLTLTRLTNELPWHPSHHSAAGSRSKWVVACDYSLSAWGSHMSLWEVVDWWRSGCAERRQQRTCSREQYKLWHSVEKWLCRGERARLWHTCPFLVCQPLLQKCHFVETLIHRKRWTWNCLPSISDL